MKSSPHALLVGTAALFSAVLQAQTAPAPASASTAGQTTETVELSPFTVNADKDVGYVASASLAGSRLNTPLRDTAASISVMTAEFLSDIGATNLTEALEWGNNVQKVLSDDAAIGTAPGANGFFSQADNFRVRGINATITRNYFEWQLPTDSYNIERIEDSRGPNSILFGIGSAGGIINFSTKQALLGRTFRNAAATFGSYGSYRGTLDLNQTAFDRRLAVRLNALYDHTGTWKTYGFSDRRRVHLAAAYNITTSTRLRAEYEIGDNHENISSGYVVGDASTTWLAAGRPTLPNPIAVPAVNPVNLARYGATRITYVENSGSLINMGNQNFGNATGRPITDESIAHRSINTGGPGQLRDSHFSAFSAFLEQKLGKSMHVALAYNHQETHSVVLQQFGDSNALTFDPNGTLAPATGTTARPVNPFVGRLMFDGPWRRLPNHARSDDTRLTLSTEHDFGKWGNYRVAALGEYEARAVRNGPQFEVWAGRPFNANPENAANQVFRRNYVTEGDWGSYHVNSPGATGLIKDMRDPVTGRTLSSTWVAQNVGQRDNPNYQTTFLLGGQARYFKGRLVVGLGYRHDALDIVDRGGLSGAAIRDPVSNEFVVDYVNKVKTSVTGRTRTLGIVGHVTRNISLLYNQSNNFDLPNVGIRVLPDSTIPGNPKGVGRDIGIALNLLDGKYNARAVYYTSSSKGLNDNHGFGGTGTSPTSFTTLALDSLVDAGLITEAVAAPRRSTANGIVYDRASEGYEFTLTANPTKNWRLQANYSYTTSFEENIGLELKAWADEMLPFLRGFPGSTLASNFGNLAGVIVRFEEAMRDQFALEGASVGANRKHRVNFFTRYSFSTGLLKGAYVGGGYRHQSKNVAGRQGALGEFMHGRSYWLADALAGYRFDRFDRLPLLKRVNLQLNIANLFDDDEPLPTSFFDDGTLRRWVAVPGRSWRLSASVEF